MALAVGCTLVSCFGCTSDAMSEKIGGPEETIPGLPVIFSVDVPADWHVLPYDAGTFFIDSTAKKITFSSPEKKRYVVIASVKDSSARSRTKLLVHEFFNGVSPSPLPNPPPNPSPAPAPTPDIDPDYTSLGTWAAEKAKELVKSQNFDRERKSLSEAFLETTKLIENGTLTTGESARTKQRDNARKNLSAVSGDSLSSWEAWNLELADKMADFKLDTVSKIGKAYNAIGNALVSREWQVTSDEPSEIVPEPQKTDTRKTSPPQPTRMTRQAWQYGTSRYSAPCPNGNCPIQ